MKELFLIRHGKSDWDHAGLSDHDRPLNDRGRRDGPAMGRALRSRGVKPDLVISSTAVRAATTADMVSEVLGFGADRIVRRSSLYLASPGTILREIQSLEESAAKVLIFGHNPGMHEAVCLLSGEMGVESFPTLAVARFELDVDFWWEVEEGCGLLTEFLIPRDLSEG